MNERDEDFLLNCTSNDHSMLTEALNKLLHQPICEDEKRARIETLIELVNDFTPTD